MGRDSPTVEAALLGLTNTFATLRLLSMNARDKNIEILAPRHQIAVLPPRRLTCTDDIFGKRSLGDGAARAGEREPDSRARSLGVAVLPMHAAITNGFFAKENLAVDYAQFVSSRPTFIQVDQREIEFIIRPPD